MEDSANWWVGYRINGKQFLRSTRTQDRRKAEGKLKEARRLEQIAKIDKVTGHFVESTSKTRGGISLKAAIRDWLKEAKIGTIKETWSRYESVARDFCEFIGATENTPTLKDVSTNMVRDYLDNKRKAISARTTNGYRSILLTLFSRGLRIGLASKNPVLPIRLF